jgi:hypothetical protein
VLYLLRKSSFDPATNASPEAVHTKLYQHVEMMRVLERYTGQTIAVAEIGPHAQFDVLNAFRVARRAVIDPYDNAGGCGLPSVPANLPYPVALYRCLLGVDSAIVPGGLFDLTFSISVIEHIGQREANYDCRPTANPPKGQEDARRAFCEELFRVTSPGGVTIHSVDHAARNLSYVANFLAAGFEALVAGQAVSVEECLSDPDAVRQKRAWHEPRRVMSEADRRLNSVLIMGFARPK